MDKTWYRLVFVEKLEHIFQMRDRSSSVLPILVNIIEDSLSITQTRKIIKHKDWEAKLSFFKDDL